MHGRQKQFQGTTLSTTEETEVHNSSLSYHRINTHRTQKEFSLTIVCACPSLGESWQIRAHRWCCARLSDPWSLSALVILWPLSCSCNFKRTFKAVILFNLKVWQAHTSGCSEQVHTPRLHLFVWIQPWTLFLLSSLFPFFCFRGFPGNTWKLITLFSCHSKETYGEKECYFRSCFFNQENTLAAFKLFTGFQCCK